MSPSAVRMRRSPQVSHPEKILAQRPRPAPRRRSERESLSIPFRLRAYEKEVSGATQDLSPHGLRITSDTALRAGTPLMLHCSFGETCYLNISGQVVFCRRAGEGSPAAYTIGIKFAAMREWEEHILVSALQALKQNPDTQGRSLLTILLSKDTLAEEAAKLSAGNLVEHPSIEIRSRIKRRKSFTPDPPWVIEMNQYLEPYRHAIWQTKLVQETSSGQLSLRQVRGWSIQFYPFIEHFPQFMATYLAKASDPVSRAFLIDNLRVEKRHADQWIHMAKGFGVPREELFTTPILPEVEALTHWMWSITNRGSFVEAVAATNYAIEGVTQGIASIMIRGFDKYHGKDGVFLDKKSYYWMEAHSRYDDLHPLEALEVIKLHAIVTETQKKVQHAAQRSLEYLFRALEACYSAYAPEPWSGSKS